MGLNLRALGPVLMILGAGSVSAKTLSYQEKYLTTQKVKVYEVTKDVLNQERKLLVSENTLDAPGLPDANGQLDPTANFGKIISTAKDLVALGEDVYKLVIKGRPANTTDYAPISVIPKDKGVAVDILDVEGFSTPVKRTYEIKYTNFYGMDTVVFRYSVIFSYNGSYNGRGAYITGAQIIPETARTMYGYDFRAIMKLGGIQNGNTRENPVAGATLLLEYEVKTVLKADLSVDSFFINGRGTFKAL
jgi:hypothetical protein